jgi:5,10-methylenetetrahydromethanopterin reductase
MPEATDRPIQIGMCFDRTFPAAKVVDFAQRLDQGGADQLWIIEDCFYTGGVSLAAAALAVSERLTVGLGILPAVARNPSITAMEIATLCGIAPGRVLPGIGHGVQEWMEQMGARTPSPLTTLDEVITVVTRLLAGDEVSFNGREVHLDRVRLDQPPDQVPPVLAGVRGPRSLALAGRVAGGLVLAEPASPTFVRRARQLAASERPDFHVAAFAVLGVADTRREAYEQMTGWLGRLLDNPSPEIQQVPFYTELARWYGERGRTGLADIPSDWWAELGPIGTLDDARDHLEALAVAGADSVGLFPAPDVSIADRQLADVLRLCGS